MGLALRSQWSAACLWAALLALPFYRVGLLFATSYARLADRGALGLQKIAAMSSFTWVLDLDSGPHAGTASTLPSPPPLQLPKWLIKRGSVI